MVGLTSTLAFLFCPLQNSVCMCCSTSHFRLRNNVSLIGVEKRRVICFHPTRNWASWTKFLITLKIKLSIIGFGVFSVVATASGCIVVYLFILGGPKLRRWYGAPDLLPKDGSAPEEDEATEEEEIRDAVLVTDGDSEIGQMVILSLIVKRIRVKALVKDTRAAVEAFGTYVESIAGTSTDNSSLKKALSGARAVICTNEGFLSNIESWKGLEHVILLSQLSVYRGKFGILAIMNSNARNLAEQDESALMASGIPYTIIRAGALKNTPGVQGFSFEKDCATQGSLSKEDAAFICVEALDAVPEKGFVFEVVNGEEKVSDWKKCLAVLMQKSEQ